MIGMIGLTDGLMVLLAPTIVFSEFIHSLDIPPGRDTDHSSSQTTVRSREETAEKTPQHNLYLKLFVWKNLLLVADNLRYSVFSASTGFETLSQHSSRFSVVKSI
jgi:hypothetical protein